MSGKDLPDNATDTIPARKFLAPACVVDMADKVSADPDYLITVADVEAWEAVHGRIPAGAWALLRTGWSERTGPEGLPQCARGRQPHPGAHRTWPSSWPRSGT
ncbi:MAG: cyclase family protein [Caulobacteraceae bacterium]